MRLSTSLYWVDHSDNAPASAGRSRSILFNLSRSGAPYGLVFGGGNAPESILPGSGKLVIASQTDATYFGNPFEAYANFGYVSDEDINGMALLSFRWVSGRYSAYPPETQKSRKYRVKGKKDLLMTHFNINPPTALFGLIRVADEIVISLDVFFEQPNNYTD